MDNITHSLAGILIAEAACEICPTAGRDARLRNAALWVSVVANNFPDLDFVCRRLTPGKLGYLLHHRGYTHTIPGALALSAATVLGVFAWSSARRVRFGPRQWRLLSVLAVLGTLVHVAFDFLNNYGVHPFWPVDDRWYYGDTLFIVEPLLWAVSIPVIASLARTKAGAVAPVVLFISVLAFGAIVHLVASPELVGLVLLACCIAVLSHALSRGGRVLLGVGSWALVTLCFAVSSRVVLARVARASSALFPAATLLDVVRTPAPGNPLCWSVITVGVEGRSYVARRGEVSLAEGLLSPRRCHSMNMRTATAPLAAIESEDHGVLFRSEFRAPVDELRRLDRTRCDAAAFLRYARVPFWTSGRPAVIGDLRFDRSRALEFAEMTLGTRGACPPNVPRWVPPRAAVLGLAE